MIISIIVLLITIIIIITIAQEKEKETNDDPQVHLHHNNCRSLLAIVTQLRLYSTLSSSRTCCLYTISISTWSTINSRCICIIINVVVWQLLSLNCAYIQQGNTLFQKALKDAFNDLVNREVGKFKTGKILLLMMINIYVVDNDDDSDVSDDDDNVDVDNDQAVDDVDDDDEHYNICCISSLDPRYACIILSADLLSSFTDRLLKTGSTERLSDQGY